LSAQVVEDAEAEYLSFFAGKAVTMVRAPDAYVYPAPFNLVETFLVAPLEFVHSSVPPARLANESDLYRFVLSESAYAKVRNLSAKCHLHTELQSQLNRFVMSVLFFIPTTIIALYESFSPKQRWLNEFMNGTPLEDEDSPIARDPDVGGEDAANGLVISRVPYAELVKEFPNIHEVSSFPCSITRANTLFCSRARLVSSRKSIR
jgi:hypothetical protein